MFQLAIRVWKIFDKFHTEIKVILALEIFLQVLLLAQPYFYGEAITALVERKAGSLSLIVFYVLIAFAAFLVATVFSWIKHQYEIKNFDIDIYKFVSMRSSEKLFSFSVGQHRNEHTGLTQSVVSEGQDAIAKLISLGIYQAYPIVLSLPIASLAVMWISVPVGILVVCGFLMYIIISTYINKKFIPDIEKDRDIRQQTFKRWREVTSNAHTVSLQAAGTETLSDLDIRYEKRIGVTKDVYSRFNTARQFGTSTVVGIFPTLAFLLAIYLAHQGMVEIGAVVTIMIWVNRAFGDIASLNRMQRDLISAKVSAEKYFALLDMASDVTESPNPVSANFIRGEIELRGVWFKYSERRYIPSKKTITSRGDEKPKQKKKETALRDISFTIKAGERVAFVGRSGAGKSTTALLLLRGQDPDSGEILIDGVNLREFDLEGYRRKIGVVEQDVWLFDDTLRQNISLGLGENRLMSDAELDRLAKICRIDQFQDELSEGWDTMIGERGVKLSGGQRQRIAIARALAKDPAILIFDEATSSLDAENEAYIKEAIDEAARGRTAIYIAHRLSTVRDANTIYVFEEGTIIGKGKHAELMKNCPVYQSLVSHQSLLM